MKIKTNKPATKNQRSSPFFQTRSSTGFLNIQAKLSVGKAGDQFEVEADNVAEKVVNHTPTENQSFFAPSDSFQAQRQPEAVQEKPLAQSITPLIQKQTEEEERIQKQPIKNDEEKLMLKTDNIVKEPGPDTTNKIRNSEGNGSPMDSKIRSQMESGFGTNFGSVKIHHDEAAVELNQQLSAQAFTTGNDIYFNSGKYNPETKSGKQLLAHELTHTIQQGSTSVLSNNPTIQRWPWSLTPEESLEEDKREFRSQNYGPITYTSTPSGSGFEASYQPRQSRLNVTVRGKIRFADTLTNSGGSYSSPNSFMNQAGFIPIMNNLPAEVQSRILPYFQWTEDQKQIHLIRFRENIQAATDIWQNTGMSFQIDETGWEDVTAIPNINLNITEGEAVHNTHEEGYFFPETVTDEATSDHLQVEIVKQPTADDVAEITRIITEYNATTGASVNSGMIRGVRSYLGNDPGSRNSAPGGFNNLMSLESNRSDDPTTKFFFTSVNFANNESQLSEGAITILDDFFSDPMILMDNADRALEIDLQGYASAPGSAEFNSILVENRMNSVENDINNRMLTSTISASVSTTTRTNDSDTSAEADLAAFPTRHDPADFRRVDIMVTRQGRGGQNVFAHELGHVFGLGDEYAEVANGYNRPAGSAASHDQLARNAGVAGGATVGNDNRMMSTGNEVGAAHYSTFADALNQLTSKTWRIVTS